MTRTADIPLSLMRMALLDRTGEGASDAALYLRAAINARSGATALPDRNEPAEGE